ncbi:MAG: hypothetical protein KatS3mg115_0461 [Candidatus Poribacteria bacterium]|nr:MAG: hypothetical protein KatS3mg115_0461 [Candidatus Poribacteria bacterium]
MGSNPRWKSRHWAALCWLVLALGGLPSLLAQEEAAPEWLEEMGRDFQQVDRARSNRAALHRGLVEKWIRQGRLEELIAEYQRRIEARPEDAALLYGAGYAFARRGRPEDLQRAAELFTQATRGEARDVQTLAHFSLGGVRVALGDLEGALIAYQQAATLDPEFAPAHQALGEVYLRLGRDQDAIASFNAAIQTRGEEWPPPVLGLGLVYEARGEYAIAEGHVRRALELQPNYGSAILALGRLRARAGAAAEAFGLYERADALRPVETEDWKRLGEIFVELGDDPSAERAYRRGVETDPNVPELRFALGEVLWRQGSQEGAIAEYRAAVEQDPTLFERFLEPVRSRFFAGALPPEEARELLDKALAVKPDSLEAHELYAQLEMAAGRLEAAVGHYETALSLAPERTDLRWTLGELYFALNRTGAAQAVLQQAAQEDPQTARRYAEAAANAYQKQDYSTAASEFQKHLLIFPEDHESRYFLARAWEAMGRTEAAIAELETLRRQAPETQDALERLARLYHRQGQPETALAVLDELIVRRPEHVGGHWTRAEILRELGREGEAIEAYRRVVALDPEHVDAHAALARLYEERDPRRVRCVLSAGDLLGAGSGHPLLPAERPAPRARRKGRGDRPLDAGTGVATPSGSGAAPFGHAAG